MRYTIKTSGLMCGHCDATVETALLNVAGVTDADADHETQTVQVECADTVTAEQLATAVEGAGVDEPTDTFDITGFLSPALQAQIPGELDETYPVASATGAEPATDATPS